MYFIDIIKKELLNLITQQFLILAMFANNQAFK